ncbi:MAG TPA: glycoside hydrolase family 30 beta sandwich domain-containing protein, partial [Lachnospiraceae bacterium]|nr:glycoside hydrolase family 30 beta sandwich domain-containing protein [Lachnospiraceae bacterium]
HFSHFIMPGAIRIGHSRYTDRIEVTALENPDGTIVVVLLNRTDRMEKAVLRLKGNYAKVELKPLSISTCVISKR